MQSETKLLALEFGDDGRMSVKLEKRLCDSGIVLWRELHRFMIEPGEDVDAKVAAVHAHLDQMAVLDHRFEDKLMSFPPLEADRVQRIKQAFASFSKAKPRPQRDPNLRPAPKIDNVDPVQSVAS